MKFHPAAGLFPLIHGQAFDDLVADINLHGLREPITLHTDGSILDGRNRYRACQELGIEPSFIEWFGDGSEVDFVLSLNLHRRHLNESQRAMVAAKIANMMVGNPDFKIKQESNRTNSSNSSPTEVPTLKLEHPARLPTAVSNAQAAKKLNVGINSVKLAKKVIAEAEPEVVEAMEAGSMAVSTAVDVLELPPVEQVDIASMPKAEQRQEINKRTAHVSHNSGENEWYTPSNFIESARVVMGVINLDPASSEIANRTVKAGTYFTKNNSGLDKDWRGNVWVNPPYEGKLIKQFIDKLCVELAAGNINSAIVLVNNATETTWFQQMAMFASAICFPKSRVKFIDPDGNPGAPLQGQAILYFGEDHGAFADAFKQYGVIFK